MFDLQFALLSKANTISFPAFWTLSHFLTLGLTQTCSRPTSLETVHSAILQVIFYPTVNCQLPDYIRANLPFGGSLKVRQQRDWRITGFALLKARQLLLILKETHNLILKLNQKILQFLIFLVNDVISICEIIGDSQKNNAEELQTNRQKTPKLKYFLPTSILEKNLSMKRSSSNTCNRIHINGTISLSAVGEAPKHLPAVVYPSKAFSKYNGTANPDFGVLMTILALEISLSQHYLRQYLIMND